MSGRRKPLVLIVDDEPNVRRVLGTLLEQAGFAATRAASGDQALDLVRSLDPDLVITDLKMPGMDGLELLRRLRASFPEIPVVMLTAHGTVANAVEAMKRGAHDFLTKPFDKQEVVDLVGKALAQASSARREYRGPLVSGARCGIVGDSAALDKLRSTIEKIAPTPSTVLKVAFQRIMSVGLPPKPSRASFPLSPSKPREALCCGVRGDPATTSSPRPRPAS